MRGPGSIGFGYLIRGVLHDKESREELLFFPAFLFFNPVNFFQDGTAKNIRQKVQGYPASVNQLQGKLQQEKCNRATKNE
jgi:hypothetical protein